MIRTILLITLLGVLYTSAQPSLRWPDSWRTSRNRVTVGTAARTIESFATYLVDATRNALRMDEEYCMMSGKLVGVCNWIFINHNIYLAIPVTNTCCLAVPNLGPTPPDWIEKLNHTYQGMDTYLGEPAYHWMFYDGDGGSHIYYQRVADPRFPFAQVGTKAVDDALEYFNSEMVMQWDPDTFKLPSAACSMACPAEYEDGISNMLRYHPNLYVL